MFRNAFYKASLATALGLLLVAVSSAAFAAGETRVRLRCKGRTDTWSVEAQWENQDNLFNADVKLDNLDDLERAVFDVTVGGLTLGQLEAVSPAPGADLAGSFSCNTTDTCPFMPMAGNLVQIGPTSCTLQEQ